MRKLFIKKKSGGVRTVYVPTHSQKTYLRLESIYLTKRLLKECNHEVVHGFFPGHSPVTNALKHKGFKYTLSVDLKDFFDSVTPKSVPNITAEQFRFCFPEGAARQGLPSSPALANLACLKLDKTLLEFCALFNIKYTRYADDMSFSSDNIDDLKKLRHALPTIIKKDGFTINPKKTRIQYSGFGRRIITGVAVDDDIHPTREVKRRLRAALHQKKANQAHGLGEWTKLKTPNLGGSQRKSRVNKALARHIVRKFKGIPDVF